MSKYFKSYTQNKKGDVSVVSKLIITMLVLGLLIYGYGKITKGSTKVLQCSTQGGRCTTGTCDFSSEIPVLSSKAAGCGEEQICCVSIARDGVTPDAECKDKEIRAECTTTSYKGYCDLAGKCVTRCEFCSANPRESICKSSDITKFESGGQFTCGCTFNSQKECEALGDKCAVGYCGSGNSYCCAK